VSFECLVPNLINSTALQPDPLAIEAVRRRFYSQGKTVTDWAREHGFDVHLVYGVLNGRLRARRGESHRIAVALGLKAVEDSEHSAAADATNSREASMKS
jgi:gp16 family phage-associated protein